MWSSVPYSGGDQTSALDSQSLQQELTKWSISDPPHQYVKCNIRTVLGELAEIESQNSFTSNHT